MARGTLDTVAARQGDAASPPHRPPVAATPEGTSEHQRRDPRREGCRVASMISTKRDKVAWARGGVEVEAGRETPGVITDNKVNASRMDGVAFWALWGVKGSNNAALEPGQRVKLNFRIRGLAAVRAAA